MKPAQGFVQIIVVAVIALIFGAVAIFGYQKFLKKSPAVGQKTEAQASPMASVAETANWKTYTNSTFSFKYPADYKVSEYSDGKTLDLAFSSPEKIVDKNNLITSGGLVRILKKEIKQNSLDVAFDYFLHDGNIQSKSNFILDGEPAFKGIASAAEGLTEEFKYIVVANGEQSYLIHAWATKDSRTEIYRIFDTMISTFKFTSDETANWKTYENEKFSIKYPQEWTMVNSDKNADISFRSWNYSEDAAPNVLKGYQITLYIGKGYGTDAPKLGVVDSQTINWIGKTAYLEKNTWEGAFVRLRIDQTNQDVLMAIATPPFEKPLFKTFEDNKEVIMTAANSLKLK